MYFFIKKSFLCSILAVAALNWCSGVALGADSLLSLGGFTGKGVPSLSFVRGDYANDGVTTSTGRTDVPKLVSVLKSINATDYMHLVWTDKRCPQAWADFSIMAAAFQEAGINLWLYLTPPTEGVPDPYGNDFVRWAVECSKLAAKYPVVKGIIIDDFDQNTTLFNPSYCKEMMTAAHKIAPKMSLMIVSYYGQDKVISKHVAQGVIDGVILPYFYPQKNLTDTSLLYGQISSYRASLNRMTKIGKINRKMPLVVMVYASKHSQSPDIPTPSYVKDCLDIALTATKNGLANGVVTYRLPKNDPAFLLPVANSFSH
jgi:hypothetical protein